MMEWNDAMNKLYKEFELERGKLDRMVAEAMENRQAVAENREILRQSHKVDSIIEEMIKKLILEKKKDV